MSYTALGVCIFCGAPAAEDRIEVTSLGQTRHCYTPGLWRFFCACPRPMVAEDAPYMGDRQDVPVPTPEELLREAGIPVV